MEWTLEKCREKMDALTQRQQIVGRSGYVFWSRGMCKFELVVATTCVPASVYRLCQRARILDYMYHFFFPCVIFYCTETKKKSPSPKNVYPMVKKFYLAKSEIFLTCHDVMTP
jgi:hypothetical protein